MAIFHHHLSTISRGSATRGIRHSVFAAVAYAGALRINDGERTHDWRKKAKEIVRSDVIGMICPPEDFARLCEEQERRWDARVGRSLVVAMPKEVTDEERWRLAKGYALAIRDRYGCASFVALHRPSQSDRNPHNHHAHFILSTRRVDDGKFTKKIRVLDSARTSRDEVLWMRSEWERRVNKLLEKHGIASISRAAVADRPAAKKLSPVQAAMERRGKKSRAGTYNRILRRVGARLSSLDEEIAAAKQMDNSRPRHGRTPVKHSFHRFPTKTKKHQKRKI